MIAASRISNNCPEYSSNFFKARVIKLANILKIIIDKGFPKLGTTLRAWKNLRRLERPFRQHSQFGFKFLGNDAMTEGRFEVDEIGVICDLLPRADRFVDIGANIGYYTCISRQMGKPSIAFEPLESNLMVLFANLSANAWLDTEVWPIGLADTVGMMPIYGSDTAASLIPGWANQMNPRGTAICINKLDNVLADRFSGERLLMKIDVEGFELAVLRGGLRVFDRAVKPVTLIEISLALHYREINENYLETFEFFWSRGYRLVTADAARRPVERADIKSWIKQKTGSWTHNWLALPRDFS
jgi:FkbM family methyltransferase